MTIQSKALPNNIYMLNSDLTIQQLVEAASACLCKAEALAVIAATTEFESFILDVK